MSEEDLFPTRKLHSTFILQSDEDLGAVEVATFISLVLFGLSIAQGYTYYSNRGEDTMGIKVLVGLILFLEASHSFTASQTIFYDTITRYTTAQPNSFPLATTVAIETIITIVVQIFFCFRILRLSQRYIMASVCCTLSCLRFVGGFYLTVKCYLDVPNNPNGVPFVEHFSWLITSSLAVGAAADVLIAASMSYYLRLLFSPMNSKSTTVVLNRLVRWSLQTGLLTSLASVAVIVCFQTMGNMVWFGVYVILAKFYANSLLVALNTRPQRSLVFLETTGRSRGHSSVIQFERPPPQISISFPTPFSTGQIQRKWSTASAPDSVFRQAEE